MGIVTTQQMVDQKAKRIAEETFEPGTLALDAPREALRARIVELFGAGGDVAFHAAQAGKPADPDRTDLLLATLADEAELAVTYFQRKQYAEGMTHAQNVAKGLREMAGPKGGA